MNWTSVALPKEGDREGIQVWSVAARSSGFLAGGAVLRGQRRFPAIWLSPDGVSWSKAMRLPGAGAGEPGKDLFIDRMAANTARMLAVSGRLNGEELGRIWSSTDGVDWRVTANIGPNDGELRVLTPTESGFVAGFLRGAEEGPRTVSISSSRDAATWRPLYELSEAQGQLPLSIAADSDRVLVLTGAQGLAVGPTPP